MDELLWLLLATATVSAAVASFFTWCLVAPRESCGVKTERAFVLHDSDESEDDHTTTLPITATLDANSKFFVSSAGKTLPSFQRARGVMLDCARFVCASTASIAWTHQLSERSNLQEGVKEFDTVDDGWCLLRMVATVGCRFVLL